MLIEERDLNKQTKKIVVIFLFKTLEQTRKQDFFAFEQNEQKKSNFKSNKINYFENMLEYL